MRDLAVRRMDALAFRRMIRLAFRRVEKEKIKSSMKVNLYEKSHHKCVFLREVSEKLSLNTEIFQKDIVASYR